MRYELADYEWTAIKPMLPNKPRGVPRVNDIRQPGLCVGSRAEKPPEFLVSRIVSLETAAGRE
jgi:transposase